MNRIGTATLLVTLATTLLGGAMPNASAEDSPAQCANVIGGATGLLARDDILTVPVGSEASVDLILNDRVDADRLPRTYLVEPVTPPAGSSIGRGTSGPVSVTIDQGYTGSEWTTYAYNLWDGSSCIARNGDRVLTNSTASLTVHVTGLSRERLTLRDQTVSVRRGEVRDVRVRGAASWSRVRVLGAVAKHDIRLQCDNGPTCRVRGGRAMRPVRFLMQVTTPGGDTARAVLVVRPSR